MENAKETYVLKMDHIVKEYFGNRVLKGVDLAVRPGEIHALMGENGAGKSTLMNILFGMPVIHNTGGFEGTVEIDGKVCEWGDVDMWRCYAFYTHAGRYYNPFVPKEVFDENENGSLNLLEGKTSVANEEEILKVYTALQKYFPSWVGYNMVKCGGCIRACVSMLEKKGGCLEGRFRQPLRTRKRWRLER